MSAAPRVISEAEGDAVLDWLELAHALERGHHLPRARVADSFLSRSGQTVLTRTAWIDGLGIATKTATIYPGNPTRGFPGVNGGVMLFSDTDGTLEALVDFHLVTRWKTAADSLLGALRLARPDSREILIVGAGAVAGSLIPAYRAGFPGACITLWNRTRAGAERLADSATGIRVADDLETAVAGADIVACATMSETPILEGAWLRPGTHVDLIGAFRPDMREADDTALRRARIFVDNRETVLEHIGELKIPLAAGVIEARDVLADFYDLAAFTRAEDDITLFKNGGGAHLDLMTARHILARVSDT